ncbi:hypothetical protein HRbin12_01275 [bacterium HR12]|nr:hypothetical protein HRbin12_01275 [bacterium HR12]
MKALLKLSSQRRITLGESRSGSVVTNTTLTRSRTVGIESRAAAMVAMCAGQMSGQLV